MARSRAMPSARAAHEPSLASRLGLTVGIAIALAGCGQSGEADPQVDTSLGGNEKMTIWTAPDTGCRYIIYRANYPANYATGGITVRFTADGKPDCPVHRQTSPQDIAR